MFTSLLFATLVAHQAAQAPVSQAPAPSQGIGDLLIAPTRIVLEGSRRNAEINLLNTGETAATYRISLIHQRMNADGKLEEVSQPGPDDKFADDLVRFTPRQVVLEPHVAQLVRVQVRLPAELAAGEYRSHMLFRAVPVAGAPVDGASGTPAKGINIKITPIYGVSIPVIVRSGETTVTTSIDGLQFGKSPDGESVIAGTLHRTGNASAYGQVVVTFAPEGGLARTVGMASGLAVYTPIASRTFGIRLTPPADHPLSGGTLKVTYRQLPADGDRVLAVAELKLP